MAPQGHYAADRPFFSLAAVDNAPLHALASTADGANGVYAAGGGFPDQSYQSTNYWVDVVFATGAADTLPPTVLSAAGRQVRFSEPLAPATVTSGTVSLKDPAGAVVPGSVSYDAASGTVQLTPTGPLAAGTAYTGTAKGGSGGITDIAGNALASDYTWSFTTAPASSCPCSLWPATATPANPSQADSGAYELGLRFRADADGVVSGIRFYKGAGNGGTHVGHLWTAAGALLGSATFTAESASGWQQVDFATPIAVAAGQVYVASYFAPQGHYAADRPFFSLVGLDAPPLHALADDASGLNGVFAVDGGFPTQGYQSTNYWVDVVYRPT
jgi:hypothetical protein